MPCTPLFFYLMIFFSRVLFWSITKIFRGCPCKKCDCRNRLKIDYNHTIVINNLRCNNHHVIRFLSIISVIPIIIDLEYFFKIDYNQHN